MSGFEEFGAREKSGWSDSAIIDAYIKHFVPITDHVGFQIVENHVEAGDTVLDLCCGQGTLTGEIHAAGAEVVGLDFSPEMAAKARKAAPGAEIVEGDAMAMPFENARFDKVICNFGMMHIPDQPKALSEIRRVLKPGGEFTMATWVGPGASPAFAAVFGALRAHADFSAAPPQPDLFAFAVPEQARSMMETEGLVFGEHRILDAEWVLEEPTELFAIFLTGTVGAGMLIRSQGDDVIETIANGVSNVVSERHRDGSGYRVPVPVAVMSARSS